MDQEAIVRAVAEGRAAFEWVELTQGLDVFADALKVDCVRVNVSARTSQQVADLLGASLTTPAIEDEIYRRARVRIPAFTLPDGGKSSWEDTLWHSKRIDQELAKYAEVGPGVLVGTVGKSWVLDAGLLTHPGRACNYGMHSKGAPYAPQTGGTMVWQQPGYRHDLEHFDYSQTLRLCRGSMLDMLKLPVRRQPGVPVENRFSMVQDDRMSAAIYVPPVRTVVTTTEALVGLRDGWRRRFGATPSAACIAVFCAQSALESGWWRSMWCFNLSNIKAGGGWLGKYTCIRLNEREHGVYVYYRPTGRERPDGTLDQIHEVPPGHPQTRMRAYDDFAQGCGNKLDFFSQPKWLRAREFAERGEVGPYVQECARQGYFTAEEGPYERSVVSIYKKLLPDAEEVVREALPAPQPEPIDDVELCKDMAQCMRFELPDWLAATVRRLQAEHVDFALDLAKKQRDEDIAGGG